MRIRKKYPNPLQSPNLSPLPPSTAAVEVAPRVAATRGATAGKEGEAMAVVSAEATAYLSDGGCSGGGGRKLHLNGRTTNLAAWLPFRPWPSAAAAAAGGVKNRDLPPPSSPLPTGDMLSVHGHGEEEPKREQDEKEDGDIGVAQSYCGGNAPAPKRLDASEVSVVHGWHKMLPSGAAAALAAAEAMVGWSDIIEGEFPPKKRRGRYQLAHGRSLELDEEEEEEEEEEENVAAEREMNPPRPSKSRRGRTAASSTTTMAPPAGTAPASAGIGTGINGGAPSATGDGAGAINKECEDVVVKEEGGDTMPTAAAAFVDGNRGNSNRKKRRRPAVLMEGSRCSRVNGRGWRCCQQTLVGYSLCEHHLGKGRLRSVSSVRCNNGRARKKEEVATDGAAPSPPSPLRQQNGQLFSAGDGEDEEEEKPSKRRRNRIGVVKARSISSLLHQPDHPTPITVAAPATLPSPSTPTPATVRPVTTAAPPPYCTDTMVA